jgi:poly-gamma-glutamate synthesis protein (capsule biosynthesis protein)
MKENGSVVLSAVGDIMLHGRYDDLVGLSRQDHVFSGVRSLFSSSDLVVGNMETVLTHNGSPRDDKLCLKGDPSYAQALEKAGINILTLANNHCLDYGIEGLTNTKQALGEQDLKVLGAGRNYEEAAEPLIVEEREIRFGFLAFCHDSTKHSGAATSNSAGIAPLDYEKALESVAQLKQTVDHVILLLHWGLEYSHYPTPEQVEFARNAIDQGASAILGHHSHCIQGIETYNGGIIAYSLANFTDASVDWQGPKQHFKADLTDVDRESFLLRLEFNRDEVRIKEKVALWLDDDGRPVVAEADKADKIVKLLGKYSTELDSMEMESFWEERVIESRVSAPLMDWWRGGSLWEKIKKFHPSQFVTLYLLLKTYLKIRFARSESKWMLFNPRNDTRPMPSSKTPNNDD